MGRPDKAARAAIARRRSDAIDLRLAGVDWLTIARKLAADPTVNSDGIAYPQGYGVERYRKNQDPPTNGALIHAACRDVRTALADRRAELNDDVDELRAMESDRLDRLFFVAYKKAVRDQDLAAIDRTLRIMERRARLLGLDMPVRAELSGPDGGPVQVESVTVDELDALIALTDPDGK
ncbi:hypothetical protein QF037_006283 [Streptomyces canus]|uniref:hypothetical protein n=1 Tax=Streptomyces canus TaxID=58343 RepID=UPI0027840571|nr:hypothetical protein [Streptomyces canus]MDQ0601938.1 hypothetical protein [Streptomyces canus]